MPTLSVKNGIIFVHTSDGDFPLCEVTEAGDLIAAILAVAGRVSLKNLAGGGQGDGFFLEYVP